MEKIIRKTREVSGNRYSLIRDCVQAQKPFAIYNFVNAKQYNQFLADLDKYGKLKYVLQVLHSNDPASGRPRLTVPSIFITNDGTDVSIDDFKNIVKGSIKHYNMDSIVCLYDGQVAVFYKNGEYNTIGNDIYSSTHRHEFQSDCYQIESIYYTFIL
jgi:hypothetical protein